jgi:hypothetical protein
MVLSTARRVLVGARVGLVRVDGVGPSLIHRTIADRLPKFRPRAAQTPRGRDEALINLERMINGIQADHAPGDLDGRPMRSDNSQHLVAARPQARHPDPARRAIAAMRRSPTTPRQSASTPSPAKPGSVARKAIPEARRDVGRRICGAGRTIQALDRGPQYRRRGG